MYNSCNHFICFIFHNRDSPVINSSENIQDLFLLCTIFQKAIKCYYESLYYVDEILLPYFILYLCLFSLVGVVILLL